MHTGSDILDVAPFLAAADILLDVAHKFKDLDYIDFGSGFKVPYKAGDISTNIEEMGELLSVRFRDFCKNYGREVALCFEPGKFLVSQAGKFLVEANVVKTTPSTVFVGVNSGLNHLIRPMFYESYHHIENVTNPDGKARIYTVVGYICETDTFGTNRQLGEVREGDILSFSNAGAYCMTMASNYNSRVRPAEVLIHEGKAHLVRKRETIEDVISTQVGTGLFEQVNAEIS
jgi:diaminopimelate decarboxylase